MKNTTRYINCPVCCSPDTRQDFDNEGNSLIFCTNHACGSNGGDNFDNINLKNIYNPTINKLLETVKLTNQMLKLEKWKNKLNERPAGTVNLEDEWRAFGDAKEKNEQEITKLVKDLKKRKIIS